MVFDFSGSACNTQEKLETIVMHFIIIIIIILGGGGDKQGLFWAMWKDPSW